MTTPTFLGPYKIGGLIGRGGMGNVYAAEHHTTGDEVAVKLIAAHVADEPRFRRRFEKEIHALKLLKHPGIVRIVGYGEQDGQLFYSMELVRGETLHARIRREKRMDWKAVIEIAIQVCAALKHAHDIGIQHRDLKPANLMLTPDGAVKLVDFGIPKNFWDSAEETATGSVLGTPDYMAPEQASGGQITGRTDLYSLGSVMYAMLAGRSPFKGKNATAVIEALKRDRPIPLQMIAEQTPDELSELVDDLLEKDPADRPRTALVVSNRLKAMQLGLMSQATLGADDIVTQMTDPSSPAGNVESTLSSIAFQPSSPDPARPQPNSLAKPKTDVGDRDKTRSDAKPSPAQKKPQGVRATKLTDVPERQSGDTSEASTTQTRFEVVKHDDPTLDVLRPGGGPTTSHSSVSRAITVGMTLLIAAVLGWAVISILSPPDRNELYDKAIDQQDADAASAFIARYADDARLPEMRELVSKQQLRSTLNRIKAQQALGLKPLTPAEESFLAAMELRENDPAKARQKIQQWLAVFQDAPTGREPESRGGLQSMIQSARDEWKRLETSSKTNLDSRARQLLLDIQASIDAGDPSATKRKLEAIKATFADAKWAVPVIQRADQWLEMQQIPTESE